MLRRLLSPRADRARVEGVCGQQAGDQGEHADRQEKLPGAPDAAPACRLPSLLGKRAGAQEIALDPVEVSLPPRIRSEPALTLLQPDAAQELVFTSATKIPLLGVRGQLPESSQAGEV